MDEQDNTDLLKGGISVADMEKALKDKADERARGYKPNDIITTRSGTRYRIGERGNWIRLS